MFKKIYRFFFPTAKQRAKRAIEKEINHIMTEVMSMRMAVTDDTISHMRYLEKSLREITNDPN